MNYGSVCSGVEAATLAWGPLGWKAVFFAEVLQIGRLLQFCKKEAALLLFMHSFRDVDRRKTPQPANLPVRGNP